MSQDAIDGYDDIELPYIFPGDDGQNTDTSWKEADSADEKAFTVEVQSLTFGEELTNGSANAFDNYDFDSAYDTVVSDTPTPASTPDFTGFSFDQPAARADDLYPPKAVTYPSTPAPHSPHP